jgi:flavin reductase (DIM6/NTAB) family NADH-FMN oxidoreductase RutF
MPQDPAPTDAHQDPAAIERALGLLPTGRFLLTSAFDEDRRGVIVHSAQPCGREPWLLAVALRKGHAIEPVIRDARCFALNAVGEREKLFAKKFADHAPPDNEEDPFDAIPVRTLVTGAPVLKRPGLAYDCEVARHFDLESDCELYVGLVRAVRLPPAEDSP